MKPKGKPIKWTLKIAYAVGLITTDGSSSSDGRHLDLTSKDIQLLNTFKQCLEINNRITPKWSSYTGKKSCFHVQFGNVIFYRWLLNIGLMPNKTKRLGALKIPDKFFFDFLRGCLDGDGCIRKYQDPVYPNSQRVYTSFFSASLPYLKWLQTNTKKLLRINSYIRKGAGVFILTYAKKSSLILLSKIYFNPETPRLKRKYKIIQDLI